MKRIASLGLISLMIGSPFAWAQVKMDGTFVAAKDCPAVASIKKNTNPGDAAVVPGTSYALLGKNKPDATHYWIDVPGARPSQRWVAVSCGQVDGRAAATAPGPAPKAGKATGGGDGFYILALSWEPAFCESMSGKAECKFASSDAYDATHLSLHGLWPQPRNAVFCNVDPAVAALDDNHRWEQLPEPEMSAETRQALDKVMPGTKSMLQRHEWIKHGTCFPADADGYFKAAARLTESVNQSAVQAFIASNIGKTIQTRNLLDAFDQSFGTGAGQRVRVACKDDGGRQLISELTIGLKGDVAGGASLADLMMAATPTSSGCPSGVIDPAGRQ